MRVVLEGLTLERFFFRPVFKMLHDVIGKVEKQEDHNGSDVNFWHNDARAMLAILNGEPPKRGFRYSSVIPDHGDISVFIKTKKTFSLQGKWWGLDEATFLREKVTPNIPQGSQVDSILRSHGIFESTDSNHGKKNQIES